MRITWLDIHTVLTAYTVLAAYALPFAIYSSGSRFSALYSDKTHFTNHSIYTRLILIPLSDTPIVQKMIN
jgi:hypothetical protein